MISLQNFKIVLSVVNKQDQDGDLTTISYFVRAFTPEIAIAIAGQRLGQNVRYAKITNVSVAHFKGRVIDVKTRTE